MITQTQKQERPSNDSIKENISQNKSIQKETKKEKKQNQILNDQIIDIDDLNLNQKLQDWLNKRQFQKIIKKLENNKEKLANYPKLKYKKELYELEQNLCIKSEQDKEYVAKLKKIYNLKLKDKNIPLVQVCWYYRKSDMKNLKKEDYNCLSENEVFLTQTQEILEVETIICHAQILSYEEYDNLSLAQFGTYFSRATYDPKKKQFNPPMIQWKKTCLCQIIPNPDLNYISCDVCKIWFHLECVQIKYYQVQVIQFYICPSCQVNQNYIYHQQK